MRSSLPDDERGAIGAERVAAWLLVVLAIGFAVAVVTGPGATVATNTPEASFDGSFDGETGTLQMEHAGGDTIESGPTAALVVVVSDGDTDHSRNVTWVDDDGDGVVAFPVEQGDAVSIDDATGDTDGDGNVFDGHATVGFTLDAGDTASVVWRGRPFGAPEQVNTTLDTYTIQESG